MGRPFFSARYLVLLSTVLIFGITSVAAQQPASAPQAVSPAAYQPGIYLVFPFENAGAPPRVDWLGEGLEELTIQRLTGAGAQVYSHAGDWSSWNGTACHALQNSAMRPCFMWRKISTRTSWFLADSARKGRSLPLKRES